MKILLITSSYPPVLGGLQTVTHTLAQHLLHQGHEVQVVTNRYPRQLAAGETLDGVPVQRWHFLSPRLEDLKQGRADLFLASWYYQPATRRRLLQLFQSFQPDVVNIHYPDNQIPFVLWLRQKFDFRLVVSLHGHDILGGVDTESDAGHIRLLLQTADAVTACSRYLLDKAIQLEPGVAEKGQTIHNGFDAAQFAGSSHYQHPKPYIFAYGRLSRQKGFDMLLNAFAQATNHNSRIEMILAGDGEERAPLQAQARQLGLNGRLHFWGRATSAQIVQLLNGCEFVVMPSRWEPFGLVALEAMAMGKGVLATQVGGLPEFVQGPGTQLVAPTVEGLAGGVSDWLARTEEIKTVAAQNSKHAASFTWNKMCGQYLEVYRTR